MAAIAPKSRSGNSNRRPSSIRACFRKWITARPACEASASDHDISSESFEMQRARQADGDVVDRARQQLHDRVVESVGRKLDSVDPGFVQLLEQFELDAGKSKSLAGVRMGLPLQRRRHD